MPNKIKPKRSYTTNAVPTAADLEVNEIAINWADGIAYTKDSSGQIVSLTMGGGGGSGSSGLTWSSVPASATASGTAGQIAYDGEYFYVATATNTWKRTALATWSSFTPATITGLQLWLDASDASTLYDATSGGSLVAADGGVARWEDKSGNARHATQGTSANRPARKTAIQGGKDVLRFDGTDDAFAFGSGITVPASHTVFSVFGRDTSGIHSALLGPTTNNEQYAFWWFTDDVVYQRSNSSFFTEHGTASTATGFFCLTTKRTGTTSISVHRNGSLLASVTTGTGVTNAASGSWAGVGKASSTSFHSGDACEILIYDSALSDADREAVETYLMTKWGIT